MERTPNSKKRAGKGKKKVTYKVSFDREDVAADVELLHRSQVSDSSRAQYLRVQADLLVHLYQNYRGVDDDVVVEDFFDDLEVRTKGAVDRSKVRAKLGNYDKSQKPVVFGNLTADIVGGYIAYRAKTSAKGYVAASSANLWVAAAKDLFRMYDESTTADFERHLKQVMKGFSRQAAKNSTTTGEGKQDLPFSVYQQLATLLLTMGRAEYEFQRAFMILQWNLICRASNTVNISLFQLRWVEDALQVYFAKQKTDQDGSRSRNHPRHVYANPVNPAVCPILALGIYFLVNVADLANLEPGALLFPGEKQEQRWNKALGRLLKNEGKIMMQEAGYNPEDFGSHSLRKGASSYVGSKPDGPGRIALWLRAGRTMKGVEGRYVKYDSAGDQFVGRTVSGLPLQSTDFALLPPMFTDPEPARAAIESCFPAEQLQKSGSGLYKVVEMSLASVVYHHSWLRETLPGNHPLFSTPLFVDGSVENLRDHVVCRLQQPGDLIQATGVPPQASLRLDVHKAVVAAQRAETIVSTFAEDFPQQLKAGLNEFTESQGHLTVDKVMGLFQSLRRDMLQVLEDRPLRSGEEPLEEVEEESAGDRRMGTYFQWKGGYLRKLPEGYQLPRGTAEQLWYLWVCGNASQGLPPLRSVSPEDFSDRKERRRFSDAKYFMTVVEGLVRDEGEWPQQNGTDKSRLSTAEARTVFALVKPSIALPKKTSAGRSRRITQIKWTSHLNIWRESQKEVRRRKASTEVPPDATKRARGLRDRGLRDRSTSSEPPRKSHRRDPDQQPEQQPEQQSRSLRPRKRAKSLEVAAWFAPAGTHLPSSKGKEEEAPEGHYNAGAREESSGEDYVE